MVVYHLVYLIVTLSLKIYKEDSALKLFKQKYEYAQLLQKVPYLYKDDEIIPYDDVESIKVKAEYAKKMNLGGAMMWSVDQDDFKGKCGEKNPLLKTLNKVLRN